MPNYIKSSLLQSKSVILKTDSNSRRGGEGGEPEVLETLRIFSVFRPLRS